MPFDFWSAYRITRRGMLYSLVGIGVRGLAREGGPNRNGEEGFAFLIPGSGVGGMRIVGHLIEDYGEPLTVQDNRQRHRNGRPYRWIFSRLTPLLFDLMRDAVHGLADLARTLRTTDELQAWYRSHFLHDYLGERWRRGEDVLG